MTPEQYDFILQNKIKITFKNTTDESVIVVEVKSKTIAIDEIAYYKDTFEWKTYNEYIDFIQKALDRYKKMNTVWMF